MSGISWNKQPGINEFIFACIYAAMVMPHITKDKFAAKF